MARGFRVARIFQRGDKIFLTLAFEFFLRGFEICDARDDFFPLQSGVVWLFGHAHPFGDSCPACIGGRDWGANWEEALQDCDCRRACSVLAVDKIGRGG
jgi:hypothetical protein